MKEYIFIKPSKFTRYGSIDIDGNFSKIQCNDFSVSNPRENNLIFEVCYYEDIDTGLKEYDPVCKELITGKLFDFDVRNVSDHNTGNTVQCVKISSEDLGLYSRLMSIDSLVVEPRRVSGLFNHFESNPGEKVNYCRNLRNMIEEAKSYKCKYDKISNGPDRKLKGVMKKAFRKSKKC